MIVGYEGEIVQVRDTEIVLLQRIQKGVDVEQDGMSLFGERTADALWKVLEAGRARATPTTHCR